MSIWKTKVWTPMDIACLKWSSVLAGIVIGTLMAETFQPYLVPLLIAAVVFAIKPLLSYFRNEAAEKN